MSDARRFDSTASVSGGRGTAFDRSTGKSSKVKKRVTPEKDFERLAERVWRRGRDKIKNKADFIAVYDSYMKDSNVVGDRDLRDDVFGHVQKRHRGVSDALTTKKERVKVFVRAGGKPSAAEFNLLGKVKGRTVYVRRTRYNTRDGGFKEVYRDNRGRFARKI